MTFQSLQVGTVFMRTTTTWRKRSSRTAEILDGPGKGSWFYWLMNDRVDRVVTIPENCPA